MERENSRLTFFCGSLYSTHVRLESKGFLCRSVQDAKISKWINGVLYGRETEVPHLMRINIINVRAKNRTMWRRLSRNGFGPINTFDGLLCKTAKSRPALLPNLHTSPVLIVTSDYSGQQKGSDFEAYGLLITGTEGRTQWESARLKIRRRFRAEKRRVSFKRLNDKRKRDMLQAFLNSADQLPGLCVTILVSRNIHSLFRVDGKINYDDPVLQPYCHFKANVFERILRVAHFVSFFVAGLSRTGQDVLWFTDQDDIAANDRRIIELTNIWGNILNHYLLHDLRHVRCGTTKCDNGTLQIEDLASIPDLVAGALVELVNRYTPLGGTPSSKLVVPAPLGLSEKSNVICGWLTKKYMPLKKLVYIIEEVPESSALSIKQLSLHNMGLLSV